MKDALHRIGETTGDCRFRAVDGGGATFAIGGLATLSAVSPHGVALSVAVENLADIGLGDVDQPLVADLFDPETDPCRSTLVPPLPLIDACARLRVQPGGHGRRRGAQRFEGLPVAFDTVSPCLGIRFAVESLGLGDAALLEMIAL